MAQKNRIRIVAIVAALGGLALSGCESDSSGSGSGFRSPLLERALSNPDARENAAMQVRAALEVGKFPQNISRLSGESGITHSATALSAVYVTAMYGEGDSPTLTVINDDDGTADDTAGTIWSITSGTENPDDPRTLAALGEDNQWRGVELSKDIGSDAAATTIDRTLYVRAWSDIDEPESGTADSDYLTIGYWLTVPEDTAATGAENLYDFGAFIYGLDPITSAQIEMKDGEATYTGVAAAILLPGDGAQGKELYGTVSLDVTFDSGGLEMIEGEVTFQQGGRRIGHLNLGATAVQRDDNPFLGSLSVEGTVDGTRFGRGDWSGRFFDGDNGATPPNSLAGTFAAQEVDSSDMAVSDGAAIAGVYGAHRDQ